MSLASAFASVSRKAAPATMALLFPILLMAQNYVFGPNVRVNDDSPGSHGHNLLTHSGQHLIAARGDSVYVAWEDDRTGTFHVYFARSTNCGVSFEPNVRLDTDGETYGAPSIAVDDSGGIHVAWYRNFMFYVKSTDGGRTFAAPTQASDSAGRHPALAVSHDGRRVYIAYELHQSLDTDIRLSRSTDGGASFIVPNTRVNTDANDSTVDPTVAVFHDTIVLVAWDDWKDGFFARSTDGGASFDTNLVLNDTTGPNIQVWPSIAVDSNGRVYVIYTGPGNGSGLVISDDTGLTFRHWQDVPETWGGQDLSLSSSPSGQLYLAWDVFNGVGNEVRFAFSPNRGDTFWPPVNPRDGSNNGFEAAASVVANQNGKVFVVWDDDRNCPHGLNNDVYFATGVPAAVEEPTRAVQNHLNFDVSPNPTSGVAHIAYSLPGSGPVKVAVFDRVGRLVRTLRDGSGEPCRSALVWNGRDSKGELVGTGVYFIRLEAPDGAVCRQIQMIRE